MEWTGEGVLLTARRHGESSVIAEVFTEHRGRHAGVIKGGTSRRMAPVLQPGAQLAVTWRARLADHLGNFTVEPLQGRAAAALDDRAALAGLASVCALAAFALPERQACPALYRQTVAVLDLIAGTDAADGLWPYAYLRWEAALLAETGFGLDLAACAVTGAREGLAHVSPRTGRAVTAAGAGDWTGRLLPLPPPLRGEGPGTRAEILAGLVTTGWFLEHHLRPALGERPLPPARAALVAALTRGAPQ